MTTFVFSKQKTAYEMRISDWSSDVCSSDLGYRGFALVEAGMAREGVEALTRALDMADRLGRRFMMAMFSAWLADALLQTGELDRAIEVARRAVRLASERNEPWARSVALRVVGQALGLSSSDGGKLVDRILRSAQIGRAHV